MKDKELLDIYSDYLISAFAPPTRSSTTRRLYADQRTRVLRWHWTGSIGHLRTAAGEDPFGELRLRTIHISRFDRKPRANPLLADRQWRLALGRLQHLKIPVYLSQSLSPRSDRLVE
jgi:hypothetical protein